MPQEPGQPPQTGGPIPQYAPVIAAGANLAGDALGYFGQQAANATNAKIAQEQMQFQERMSNTSWQRAVEDMKKAGLNPGLAYQQGGATTPGGASATMQNAAASLKGSAAGAAQTYSSLAANKATVENINAQTDKTRAETNQVNLESAARVELLQHQGVQAMRSGELTFQQQLELLQTNAFKGDTGTGGVPPSLYWALQKQRLERDTEFASSNARERAALAELAELDIPRAKNEAAMQRTFLGKASPFVNTIRDFIPNIGAFRPRVR